jgi:hypothetical protein
MCSMDSGSAQTLMQIHLVEARCQARYDWRLQYEAAGPGRRGQWARRLLCRLGNWLVAMGEHLEQMAPAQPSYQQNRAREDSQAVRG